MGNTTRFCQIDWTKAPVTWTDLSVCCVRWTAAQGARDSWAPVGAIGTMDNQGAYGLHCSAHCIGDILLVVPFWRYSCALFSCVRFGVMMWFGTYTRIKSIMLTIHLMQVMFLVTVLNIARLRGFHCECIIHVFIVYWWRCYIETCIHNTEFLVICCPL